MFTSTVGHEFVGNGNILFHTLCTRKLGLTMFEDVEVNQLIFVMCFRSGINGQVQASSSATRLQQSIRPNHRTFHRKRLCYCFIQVCVANDVTHILNFYLLLTPGHSNHFKVSCQMTLRKFGQTYFGTPKVEFYQNNLSGPFSQKSLI